MAGAGGAEVVDERGKLLVVDGLAAGGVVSAVRSSGDMAAVETFFCIDGIRVSGQIGKLLCGLISWLLG